MLSSRYTTEKPEIWGGLECTINRVRDDYSDQYERTGQYEQMDDLRNVCNLGISKLRFPVLWERHHNNAAAWRYTAKQLDLLESYSVIPIAGLLHHGSGPNFTNLADPAFPVLFANYAREVATAYPQIRYYTPINEPLTTARFSGLYGLWYPHGTDEKLFATIFLNQLKGIVLAMQEIRKINPDAELVQTEDLCKVHSTTTLQYQADFENERRWWTFDFLASKVNRLHYAWNYFTALGITEEDLMFFIDNPCMPAVAGFNYYATSERYLDSRLEIYPPILCGGNGRDLYVDTEAVRCGEGAGLKTLLTEAWLRFQIPLAVTECHLSCTREQQLRWLHQQWLTVTELKANSIPVLAFTVWALVGAYDWDSLVTMKQNHYESGAFRVHNNKVVSTALTQMIRSISAGMDYEHPALQGKGWWQAAEQPALHDARPLVVMDAVVVLLHCAQRYLEVVSIEDTAGLRELIISCNAWAFVTGTNDERAALICSKMNILYLVVEDSDDIDDALDLLIDQQAADEYAKEKPERLMAGLSDL